jgi:adenylate cyclase
MSFLGEIGRRKIFQVAAVYAVVAWLLIQIVATIEAPLNLPEWADTLVIVLLAVGFPITMIVSWGFNLTAEGLVRDEGTAPQSRSRTIEFALIGLLIVAVLWVLYRTEFETGVPFDGRESVSARTDVLPHSVAVLPFANLSPDPDDAYFAAGMHDEILNHLAKLEDLNVIARTSVLRYARDPPPIPEIAEALKVQTVMEGSVRYAGDKVRVTAQLIDGASSAHLWSETYDGDLRDVFTIQADIATAIAAALEAELLPETRARLEKPTTESTAAYALFLRARNESNVVNYPEAIALLDRAIAIDPDFGTAYALRAWLGAWTQTVGLTPVTKDKEVRRRQIEKAATDADRALELDADPGKAWLARATLGEISWHWKSADEEFAQALAFNPSDPLVMRNYARFLAERGSCKEAMNLSRRQALLDPNALLTYVSLTLTASYCSRLEEALAAADKGLDLAPASAFTNLVVAYTRVALSFHPSETIPLLRTGEQLITDQTSTLMSGLIYSYGLLGLTDDAARVFERFRSWAENYDLGAGTWMLVNLGIGDVESAHDWLIRELEQVKSGEPDPGYSNVVLAMRNFHGNPVLDQHRFRELFEEIEAIANSR